MADYKIIGFNAISGAASKFHIDHRIFNAASFCASMVGAFYTVLSVFAGQLLPSLGFGALFLTNALMYYFSRYRRVRSQKFRLIFLLSSFAALALSLYNNNGLLGVTPYYLLLTYMIYLTVFRMRYHIALSSLMLLLVFGAAVWQYQSETLLHTEITQSLVTLLLTLFFSLGLINYLRMNYSLEKRKVLETNKELAASQVATRKAMEEAISASKAKAEFLSTMSHEIRTPMNAVIGMTHLLLQENPREEQMDNLQTLKFSAESLLALINDILDFSKIEAGKIAFEKIEFSLKDLVRSVKEALAVKAHDKGINLHVMLDDNLPEVVMADPTRLTQILNNLVGNAVKFTQKGSVTIELKVIKRVDKLVNINFSVIDTGIGIPTEQQEKIFEKFSQASTSTTREFGGTGLGLSITKRLLELQDSEIKLISVPGKGTTFSFELQMETGESFKRKTLANIDLKMFSSLKGLKVLLVDDNKTNVLIARKFLTKWDIEVDEAYDGQSAYEKVANNCYDLALMDLQMPIMDGIGATKKIRQLQNPTKANLPIIALTASAMLEEQEAIFASGMNDFVSKPFNPGDLYKKIVQHSKLDSKAA
ncbi:response regulator [bacterium]|nr:response regulator [bacterium]